MFAYFARYEKRRIENRNKLIHFRELSTHNVRELKVFPGGRAIEIVTYSLFGMRKTEILAINRIALSPPYPSLQLLTYPEIVKPKKPFTYAEWRTNPTPLRFALLGDRTLYFISFHGNFIEPRCMEFILNGGDIKHLK